MRICVLIWGKGLCMHAGLYPSLLFKKVVGCCMNRVSQYFGPDLCGDALCKMKRPCDNQTTPATKQLRAETVRLNIGGRRFETSPLTLAEIPFLRGEAVLGISAGADMNRVPCSSPGSSSP